MASRSISCLAASRSPVNSAWVAPAIASPTMAKTCTKMRSISANVGGIGERQLPVAAAIVLGAGGLDSCGASLLWRCCPSRGGAATCRLLTPSLNATKARVPLIGVRIARLPGSREQMQRVRLPRCPVALRGYPHVTRMSPAFHSWVIVASRNAHVGGDELGGVDVSARWVRCRYHLSGVGSSSRSTGSVGPQQRRDRRSGGDLPGDERHDVGEADGS